MFKSPNNSGNTKVCALLREHFGTVSLEEIVTSSRTFPITSRVDLQTALDRVFANRADTKQVGFNAQHTHETVTIAHLTRDWDHAPVIAPLQYDEIDFGEIAPARCLKQALWLSK